MTEYNWAEILTEDEYSLKDKIVIIEYAIREAYQEGRESVCITGKEHKNE